jgi:hypothetical protein
MHTAKPFYIAEYACICTYLIVAELVQVHAVVVVAGQVPQERVAVLGRACARCVSRIQMSVYMELIC